MTPPATDAARGPRWRRRGLVSIPAVLALAGSAAFLVPHGSASKAAPVAAPVVAPVVDAVLAAPSPAPVVPSPVAPTAVPVEPLGQLAVPDMTVIGGASITAAQLATLRAIPGVTAVVPFAVGQIDLAGVPSTVIGVDPSAFRGVTPAPTASSDALWAAVAQGELLAEFAAAKSDALALGGQVTVAGAASLRLGVIAALRLPHVDGLVDASLDTQLGLVPDAGLAVMTDGRDVPGTVSRTRALLAHDPALTVTNVAPTLQLSGRALTAPLYRAAARTCPGLPWTLLAAIGTIESDNGADPGVSSAGAMGPMQFLPATFAQYAVDGDHDGKLDIQAPADAVFSAAKMLCANGSAADGWRTAVFAYNHAGWYVDAVEDLAARYAAAG